MWPPRGLHLPLGLPLGGLPQAQVCNREAGVSNWTLGPDVKIIDWLDELTATCPKKIARNMNDQCGARCPDLATVL
jgi:hypothetical protein